MARRTRRFHWLLAELKRRRVLRSAALYGGVTFVVFQAADFVIPALALPLWVSTMVVVLAVVGFPIALVAAWVFDFRGFRWQRTAPPAAGELDAIVESPRRSRWPVGIAAAAGTLLFGLTVGHHFGEQSASSPAGAGELAGRAAGAEAGFRRGPRTGATTGRAPATAAADRSLRGSEAPVTLAVLPFLDVAGGGDDPAFGEGVANELLEALRRVPGLSVTGRTSAFSYRDGGTSLTDVADGLAVSWIIDGSVGEVGDSVELAVRVLSAGDGEVAWAGVYRLPKAGFLASLDEVPRELARWFGRSDPAGGSESLIQAHTAEFGAYRDYLRGRFRSHLGSPGDLEAAIKHFNRALLLDPDFAQAWAGLATAYVLLPEVGGPPMMELLPYLEAALPRALEAGRETAEGYAASGYLHWVYLWDFEQAGEDFARSLELEPTAPTTHYWFAQFLTVQRRWEEAATHARRAVALDPRSPAAQMTLGLVLLCAGEEGAEAALLEALVLQPQMHPAAYLLAMYRARSGNLEGAREAFDLFAELTGEDPARFHAYLAALADPSGRPAAVEALEGPGFYGTIQGATFLAHLGEFETALALLQRSAEARSPYLSWVNALPQFDPIRMDPRFQSVLAWVGL